MAEIWGAAIMVGGAIMSAQAEKKKQKAANKENRAATREEAKYQGLLSQFEHEQDYYYEQLGKQEKMRGLDEFKKFHTVREIDPSYVNTNTGPIVPEKPDINKYFPEEKKVKKKKKKRGGLRGFIDKYDPLGSKLIDIDPLSSAVLGSSTTTVAVPETQPNTTVMVPQATTPPTTPGA